MWSSLLLPPAWLSTHKAHEGKLLLLFTHCHQLITKSTLIMEGWRWRSKLHCLLNKTCLLSTDVRLLIIGNFYRFIYHQSQPSICYNSCYSLFTLITPQISQIPHSVSTLISPPHSFWLTDWLLTLWLRLFITYLSALPLSNISL